MEKGLCIKKLYSDALLPKYAHENDAGMDVYAYNDAVIEPMSLCLIKTGIAIDIPKGYEVQVRSRSGLALKNKVVVLNSPGTIDCGYRNEIGVILMNFGKETFIVNKDDRIAQLVYAPFIKASLIEVESFSGETERNLSGFGDSGIK